MSRRSLGPRDRRALVVGSAVVVGVLTWVFAVTPFLRALDHSRRSVESERALLARELDLLAGAGAYSPAVLRGADLLMESAPRLFGGAEAGGLGTEVAAYVQAHAQLSRVLLHTLTPLPALYPDPRITGVPIRVTGESDLEGLLTMLQSLEAGPKLIRIDQLRIEARSTGPGSHPRGPEVLSAEFVATGYAFLDPDRPLADAPAQTEEP